jgi:hypothetical protein
MDHWNEWDVDVDLMTPEQREDLVAKLANGFDERWHKERKNWSVRDWWEDYKYEALMGDLRRLEERSITRNASRNYRNVAERLEML